MTPFVKPGHVAAARKSSHQWCVSLTPNNTKTMGRMTCHCFQRPIRRDLTSSSYTTGKTMVQWAHYTCLRRLESFRFEKEYEYERVFARVLKKRYPRKLHFTFLFHQKS